MLSEYARISERIIPMTSKLLAPYLETLDLKLRPGMVTLTWSSMNIDSYKSSIFAALNRLEEMVMKINDIVENRIQKNLRLITRSVLVNLPQERAVTLDEFVAMQEASVKACTAQLSIRNLEIETAVNDLFQVIDSHGIDSSLNPVAAGLHTIHTITTL